jgi:hypothetical protein
MSMGAQQSGTTTTTSAPPAYLLPYIGTGLGQAGQLLASGGPQYYPGSTVADLNPVQEQAFGGIQNLAGGTPGLTAANSFDTSLLGGQLNPEMQQAAATLGGLQTGASDPYLDGTFQQAANQVQQQYESEFGQDGRNVEASAPMQMEADDNLANQIYGGAYQDSQNRALQAAQSEGSLGLGDLSAQLQGLGGAESLFNTGLGGYAALGGVGDQIQNQAQNLIDANQNEFNYYQNLPWQNLGQYANLLGSFQTGQQTQTPFYTNPTAGALGGGLSGAMLGSEIMPGWGTAIGGGLGALLGYLGG